MGLKMQIVIAMDSLKGCLTSMEAGKAVAEGIRRADPEADIKVMPLADGGEGTADSLIMGMGGKERKVRATGPLGAMVDCGYGMIGENRTAVMEMACVAGLPLVPPEKRNPMDTTTYGVGEIIKDAIGKGCRNFIIGIGGSATNDGGIGMLQALGFGFLDKDGRQTAFGAKGLADLACITDTDAMKELKECRFRIACDVSNPLCGPDGCSAVYGSVDGKVCPAGERKICGSGYVEGRNRSGRRAWLCLPHFFERNFGTRSEYYIGRDGNRTPSQRSRSCHNRRRQDG